MLTEQERKNPQKCDHISHLLQLRNKIHLYFLSTVYYVHQVMQVGKRGKRHNMSPQ